MGLIFAWVLFLFSSLSFGQESLSNLPEYSPVQWDRSPIVKASLEIKPQMESVTTTDQVVLRLKHYPREGAQPLLLIHGLGQNDRCWDNPLVRYNFARFMHAKGFDVWIANLRGAGTSGFRSGIPISGSMRWTVEDYSILDAPALVQGVLEKTGRAPWLIGHSLAAWVINGYLAGLQYGDHGSVQADWQLGSKRQGLIRGVVSIGGVYNLGWEKGVDDAWSNPISSEKDFYHSNYEFELLSRSRLFLTAMRNLQVIPMGWLRSLVQVPYSELPWIGAQLKMLYPQIVNTLISSPLLSLFYYFENIDAEMVRLHAVDGNEDLSPLLVEQLANVIRDRKMYSYYHLHRKKNAFDYSQVMSRMMIPMLFVSGGRDRLVNERVTLVDGYEKVQTTDKTLLHVEKFGHMDLLTGLHAPAEVMDPIAKWLWQK